MIINFRQPDPYLEFEGVRTPLTEFPDILVTRGMVPIAGLREVNLLTSWITVGAPAPYQSWLTNPETPQQNEWQETTSNLRITGAGPLDMCITGCDMRLVRKPVARVVAAPVRQRVEPPPRPKAAIGLDAGIRLPPSRVVPPVKLAPAEQTVTLPPVAEAAAAPTDEKGSDWLDQMESI